METSARISERAQYREISGRIERAYGSTAHSLYIDAQLKEGHMYLGLQVLNRAGIGLSPRLDADLQNLVDQAASLLGPGHWLLEGKRAKQERDGPKTGWKRHDEADNIQDD